MKIQVDIFTGFLSSGKTSLINKLLEKNIYSREKVLLIQSEYGEEKLTEKAINNEDIIVKKISKDDPIDKAYIISIAKEYLPDRIIIEQNGLSSLEEFLNVFSNRDIRRYCVVNNIVNVIDCRRFDMLISIVGNNLITQISYSDIVVLNYSNNISSDNLMKLERKINSLNKSGDIISVEKPENFVEYVENIDRKEWLKNIPNKFSLIILFFISIYLITNILKSFKFIELNLDIFKLNIFNTVFISILIEAFPFLIIGTFMSSIIQIFITSDMIVKYFPQNNILSFFVAIIGGFFFPVCDCAIVPIASSLVQKGVPLHAVVTFMLSAPIVNPIVIASTYYAFLGQPSIVFLRLFLGIVVAIISGIVFLIFPENEINIVSNINNNFCGCAYCNGYNIDGNWIGKISAVFKHTGEEFFNMGKYLILGAFLTSIFQVAISKDIFEKLGSLPIVSILIMMALAFLFSICSSSDAFIARSFVNQFPMNSIMGFMILGPMIDIKNLLMLSGSFSKRFIIKLLFIVCNMIFSVLCFSTILFN